MPEKLRNDALRCCHCVHRVVTKYWCLKCIVSCLRHSLETISSTRKVTERTGAL